MRAGGEGMPALSHWQAEPSAKQLREAVAHRPTYTLDMKVRAFDPAKLDVELFARDGAELKGVWPATELQRLAADAAPEAPVSGWPDVSWLARGERRESRGSEPQIWLHLQANATVALTCQRCLQPVRAAINLQRDFRFVRDEQRAAEIDAESVEDVLALPRHLDLRELIEDELLLALPLVPRHKTCPQPLPMPADDLGKDLSMSGEVRKHPFAALAALKQDEPND